MGGDQATWFALDSLRLQSPQTDAEALCVVFVILYSIPNVFVSSTAKRSFS